MLGVAIFLALGAHLGFVTHYIVFASDGEAGGVLRPSTPPLTLNELNLFILIRTSA
jgi:hypothetical protein